MICIIAPAPYGSCSKLWSKARVSNHGSSGANVVPRRAKMSIITNSSRAVMIQSYSHDRIVILTTNSACGDEKRQTARERAWRSETAVSGMHTCGRCDGFDGRTGPASSSRLTTTRLNRGRLGHEEAGYGRNVVNNTVTIQDTNKVPHPR